MYSSLSFLKELSCTLQQFPAKVAKYWEHAVNNAGWKEGLGLAKCFPNKSVQRIRILFVQTKLTTKELVNLDLEGRQVLKSAVPTVMFVWFERWRE